VHENTGNTSLDWTQEYVYDRYGNRTLHQTNTYGTGINKKDFTVNTANNRLGVPSGQSGTMSYDNAGNLTTDTYSGAAVSRAYDAENHMTSETQAGSVVDSYSYDGDGKRVKRNTNGNETWQVYGAGGELLARVRRERLSGESADGVRLSQWAVARDSRHNRVLCECPMARHRPVGNAAHGV